MATLSGCRDHPRCCRATPVDQRSTTPSASAASGSPTATLEAVKGIDLDVRRGEVFALLGPNGAGKTTTLEILEGYRTRSGGDVSVLGHDPGQRDRQLQERVGICLQTTGIERYLSVVEVLRLYRGYYPQPRPVDELLDLVGLTEQADVRVRRLSGGQRRRLDLAVALCGDPELLFLDEPTTGFDPERAATGMGHGQAADRFRPDGAADDPLHG